MKSLAPREVLFTLFIISAFGIMGCQPIEKLAADQNSSSDVYYRLIYVIHGDANYLYHDEDGNGLQADEQKVAEAKEVARRARKGEVFIFHQKPERKILWLFPRKDRVFLHYRNGRLINREKYSPESSRKTLVAESRLYESHRSPQSSRNIFLYFGHKIPDDSKLPYHGSRPEAAFSDYLFTNGMQLFLADDQRFDLTVLSTCDNGTPRIAYRMSTVSRYLLASPQDLHLSHIDTRSLLQLEGSQKPVYDLAVSLAQETYNRLSKIMETSVTLSVYDLQSDNFFPLTQAYADYQSQLMDETVAQENIDCSGLPFWDKEFEATVPNVFYKPAAFGPHADKQSHSGWGCRPQLN